jgi:hypothetical protein
MVRVWYNTGPHFLNPRHRKDTFWIPLALVVQQHTACGTMSSNRVLLLTAVLVACCCCCWSSTAVFASAFVIPTSDSSSFVLRRSSRYYSRPTRGIARAAATAVAATSSSVDTIEFALLFDCDGVILETEEYHRLAYNEAFRKFQLTIDGQPVEWSVRSVGPFMCVCVCLWNPCFRTIHTPLTLCVPPYTGGIL